MLFNILTQYRLIYGTYIIMFFQTLVGTFGGVVFAPSDIYMYLHFLLLLIILVLIDFSLIFGHIFLII